MQDIPKEIYDKYATRRIGLYEFNRHLPPKNRKSASASTDYPSMIGMLGETLSREKLIKDGYKVYCAETYFLFLETYNDVILPKSFLNNPEIKKYQRIDRYIHDYYQVINSCLTMNFKIRKGIHKDEALIIQAAKSLKGQNFFKYWDGHPGRIDIVAEKDNSIAFFEIKTNNSQLSDWQKLRILLLQRENIRATPVRVRLYFSPISGCEANDGTLVRVPYKKKFAFGILLGKQDYASQNLFSVQIPESIKEIILQVKISEIEKVDYTLEFEEVKKLKIVEIPNKQYIDDIHQLFISFYGNHLDCGVGQTYLEW